MDIYRLENKVLKRFSHWTPFSLWAPLFHYYLFSFLFLFLRYQIIIFFTYLRWWIVFKFYKIHINIYKIYPKSQIKHTKDLLIGLIWSTESKIRSISLLKFLVNSWIRMKPYGLNMDFWVLQLLIFFKCFESFLEISYSYRFLSFSNDSLNSFIRLIWIVLWTRWLSILILLRELYHIQVGDWTINQSSYNWCIHLWTEISIFM